MDSIIIIAIAIIVLALVAFGFRKYSGKESVQVAEKHVVAEKVHDDEEEMKRIVAQNQQLVMNLHKVFEEDKVFLQNDICIDDVAKMLFTNRTYVTRLMRHEYGLSFNEYVNVARVQYSQSLLYSSDMSIDEIAERSGFHSASNYCRTFKRYMGVSPMTWLHDVKAK